MEKYSLWYDGINLDIARRSRWTLIYYPFFILKRFVFVMTPVLLTGHPSQQIQLLLLLDLMYHLYYLIVRPHKDKRQMWIEMANEVLMTCAYYHLVLFSSFVINNNVKFQFGYSFLVNLCLIMIVNIAVSAFTSVKTVRRRKMLAAMKVAYEA